MKPKAPAPLCIELFCGTFGWSQGWLEMGGRAVGFDIEHLPHHGPVPQGADLVLQDVLTLHGSQFRDASLILASPPCQTYSYMAMPWSRAKKIAAEYRSGERSIDELNRLFKTCLRIQSEACEAAGRFIPLVIENVRGAQPWIGRAASNYGSFYLWGDLPAIMPSAFKAVKVPSFRFDGSGGSFQIASVRRTNPGTGARFTSRDCGIEGGTKQGGDWFNSEQPSLSKLYGSKSPQRKMASAQIAKIPLSLSRHIAQVYFPHD